MKQVDELTQEQLEEYCFPMHTGNKILAHCAALRHRCEALEGALRDTIKALDVAMKQAGIDDEFRTIRLAEARAVLAPLHPPTKGDEDE